MIVYDHFADRWVMVWLATNRSSESWILVSVSDDSDPNGVWCNWALDGDLNGSTAAGNWADYQGLGYDNQAVYIVPNQFKFGGGFDYSKIRILPKSTLYDNSCPAITYTDIWDIRFPQAGADAFAAFTIRPAVTFGTPGAEYLLANSIFVSPNNNFMVLYKLTNPLAASPTLTAQLVVMTATNVPPNANQKGGSAAVTGCSSPCLIDVGGNRIRNVVYRDGSVWTAHSVADSTAKYARARYVRIDVGGPTLLEDVSLGATECWYYYPAIAADVNSNMVMVFNRSCSDSAAQPEYAGIRYTSRLDGGTMESSAQLKAGETNYVKTFGGSRNRWGDYSGIAVDPSSPNAVWMFAEYAASPTNKWGTWFGQVRFPSAITSPSIIFPSTGDIINTGTPLFKWQAPATGDPSSYSLQVTSGGAFTQPFDINLLLTGDSPPPTQYQVQSADALADASYDWRVVAANTTGDTASSPTSSFTVDAPPAKVVLSSPANGSTGSDTTPTFTWGEVTDPSAVTYELEIGSGTADFSVLVFTADGIQQAQYTLSSADAQATGDYIWRVRANDGAGNTGDFSDPFTFTVVDTADTTAPAKVVLSSPANGSTGSDTTPTFAWGEVTDPSGVTYELEIGSGTADFSVLVFTADGIQQAQYTLSSADAQATGDYIWRVRANDGAGNTGDFSDPFTFTVVEAVTNTPPVANNQTVGSTGDTPVQIVLTGSDAGGDTLAFIVVSLPSSGDLAEGNVSIANVPHTLSGNTVTYTADAGFTGTDSFNFKANDGTADSSTATVTINVTTGGQVTVSGAVRLEGMPNPITGARISFSTGSQVSQVFSNPQNGAFSIQLPPGTYDVKIEKDGFLPAMRAGLVVNQNIALPEVKLLWGDVDGNMVVDVIDLVIPAKNQNKRISLCGLDGLCIASIAVGDGTTGPPL